MAHVCLTHAHTVHTTGEVGDVDTKKDGQAKAGGLYRRDNGDHKSIVERHRRNWNRLLGSKERRALGVVAVVAWPVPCRAIGRCWWASRVECFFGRAFNLSPIPDSLSPYRYITQCFESFFLLVCFPSLLRSRSGTPLSWIFCCLSRSPLLHCLLVFFALFRWRCFISLIFFLFRKGEGEAGFGKRRNRNTLFAVVAVWRWSAKKVASSGRYASFGDDKFGFSAAIGIVRAPNTLRWIV